MFNALLDALPSDYKGYLIRTDYRIGIQIALCAQDGELTEQERSAIILNLLYGNGIPQDLKLAMDGIAWFMSCGNPPQKPAQEGEKEDAFSFEYDSGRVLSAFQRVYHMDISREKLHWFQFSQMLGDLDGSALTDIIGYRTIDISKMKGDERAAYVKMKQRVALPTARSEEEDAAVLEFDRAFYGK